MKKKINYKKIFLSCIILIITFSLSIGYSALSSELSISKIVADVRINKDIRITDVELVSTNNGSVSNLNYDTDSIIFNMNLNEVSSTVTLQVSITNFGNTEMGIKNISGLTDNLSKQIIGYELEDRLCDSNGICSLGSTTKFNITIGYESFDTATNNNEIKLDFEFQEIYSIIYSEIINNNYLTYIMNGNDLIVNFTSDIPQNIDIYCDGVLMDNTKYSYISGKLVINNVSGNIEVKKKEPLAKIVEGDVNTVGSIVAIGQEQFYVIGKDEETEKIKLLSMYNLNVGTYIDDQTYDFKPIPNPTGKQHSEMKGCPEGTSPCKGVTEFSLIDAKYEGSTVEGYVNNYKNYLVSLGAKDINARIITLQEVENLGCDSASNSCDDAPLWVWSTTYWTSTVRSGNSNELWYVIKMGEVDGYTEGMLYSELYDYDEGIGVRPVIEIPLSNF